jgi:hypothetical protein
MGNLAASREQETLTISQVGMSIGLERGSVFLERKKTPNE